MKSASLLIKLGGEQEAVSFMKSGPTLCLCQRVFGNLIEHNDLIHPLTLGCKYQLPPVFLGQETTFQTFSALIKCTFFPLLYLVLSTILLADHVKCASSPPGISCRGQLELHRYTLKRSWYSGKH